MARPFSLVMLRRLLRDQLFFFLIFGVASER